MTEKKKQKIDEAYWRMLFFHHRTQAFLKVAPFTSKTGAADIVSHNNRNYSRRVGQSITHIGYAYKAKVFSGCC